ncbi:T9SS type B sorting domain-containing protein [Myroides sp. DF42-4-2]|uniref:T9SS type B sorting domain-containing protein n=1 Tax=unclassified Myroides TaxID=2642485 RepID=UPI0025768AF6|nr:T9SS type B sorting domain-containing protein [Myroides sp. DF42-4-2]MDM1406481.1 T9SS type B sorting domain-containing protein [Myroides sp. DF42-4-2]
MKRFLLFIVFLLSGVLSAQTTGDAIILADGRFQACSGTLYDSGGIAGNYQKDEMITMTLCPEGTDGTVRLNFTSFLLGEGASLEIYNNTGATDPFPGGPFTRDNPIENGRTFISDNFAGCITLIWRTGDAPTAPGFSATVSCNAEPCQVITPRVLRTIPAFDLGVEPACEEDLGVIRACIGEEIQLFGDAEFSNSDVGATYTWDFDNGHTSNTKNTSVIYDEKGAYRVRFIVKDALNCSRIVSFVIQIGESEADFTLAADKQSYCVGESIKLTGSVALREVIYEPEEPESNPIALPDGTGELFYSDILFNQFCASAEIESLDDILSICIDIEHTYLGDLDIILIAPNGAQVYLLDRDSPETGGDARSNVLLGDPSNRSAQEPFGSPLTYCFSQTALKTLRGAPEQPTTGSTTRFTNTKSPGTYLPAQRQTGRPANTLNNLIGAPLNGKWSVRIEDRLGVDEGFFFGWSIKFNDRFNLPDLSFAPQVVSQRWLPADGLVETGNGNATVTTNVPGTYTFTYEVVDNFGCTYTEDITVEVKDTPILGQIRNLQACIDTQTKKATFDLTDVNSSIDASNSYDITYFNTEADARANQNALGNLYELDTTNGVTEKTIWVRVKHRNTDCFTVDSFRLIARHCDIDLVTLDDLTVCKNVDGTIPTFDLTQQNNIVYHGNPNYIVQYFVSNEDAIANTSPIANPANYALAQGETDQTIYVRVHNRAEVSEFATTSFIIKALDLPVVPTLDPLYACPMGDKQTGMFNLSLYNNLLIGGATNKEVTYYKTEQGAITGNPQDLIVNITQYESLGGRIGVRITDLVTGCFNYGSIELMVVDLPDLDHNVVSVSCSLSTADNGIASFDLGSLIPQILVGNVNPQVEVKFYKTITNAEAETNAIRTNTFVNDVPFNQIIYARVSYLNSTCFEIVEVELVAAPKVKIDERVDMQVCVDNLNREMIVDLTQNETTILDGLDPAQYEITYYSRRQDAEAKVRRITNPTYYSSIVSRSVWVRVESNQTGCYGISNVILVPVLQPTVADLPIYSVCEETGGEGLANFNLNSYIQQLLGGGTGYGVSFHSSANDANTNSNPLPSNYRNTTPYQQNLYVRFVADSGCATVKLLVLKVLAEPVLNIPEEPVSICSISNDGFGTFNLLALVTDLQNGDPSIALKFYETEQNALNDTHVIQNPNAYTNITPGGSTIYVRGELAGGCFTVQPIQLQVIASPVLPIALDDLVLCSESVLVDTAVFDLTVQTIPIISAQVDGNNNTGSLVVRYFLNEVDAQANQNAINIPTHYVNVTNNQEIWYRVYHKGTSCFAVGKFHLIVNKPLALTTPREISICQPEIPNTGRTIFDLTIRETEILGRDIDRVTFKYYENLADAKQDVNAIATPTSYSNTSNPQTIWVAVTSFNGCRDYVPLVVKVSPLPDVNDTPSPLHSCVIDLATNAAVFDLTSKAYEIAQQSSGYFFKYYTTPGGAAAGDPNVEILFPATFTSPNTTVYVRVTLGSYANPCYVVVPLILIADPQPRFDDIVFAHCLENATGFSTFNLLDKKSEILNGNDEANMDIFFYVKEADARTHNIGNAIPPDYTYTNTTEDSQTIWVRVVNKTSGCAYVGKILLVVEEQVKAFDIDLTDLTRIQKCASPTGPNGVASFDLTAFGPEIIGAQNIPLGELALIYSYNNTDIPAAQLANFELPIGTHEIIAKVVHLPQTDANGVVTEYYCTAEVTFTLTVEESPIAPVLQGAIVCIDYNTGKLVDPYTIDSGYKGEDYEFQWQHTSQTGRFTDIPGATKSYYVVEDTALGNTFRVVVKYKGQKCSTPSSSVVLTFVDEIPIKVQGADSTGMINQLDGEETITVTITSPQESSLFEYALDEGAYQDSRMFYDVANGTHRVWVRYKDNKSICPQYLDIFVLGYPKFFTPNGDGFNDTWNISALKGHPEAVIYIYDRFGKLLKQLSPSNEGWDGTFNGKSMPSTDYWFTVEYLEEPRQANQVPRKVQFKGHFSLKR